MGQLLLNAFAQGAALMQGRQCDDPQRSYPGDRSSATILATATDLSSDVVTADLGGSLRCGTTALRLALAGKRVTVLEASRVAWQIVFSSRIRFFCGQVP